MLVVNPARFLQKYRASKHSCTTLALQLPWGSWVMRHWHVHNRLVRQSYGTRSTGVCERKEGWMGKSQGSSDKSERWKLESPAGRTDSNRLNWNEATAILNVLEHWGILGTLKSNRDHFQGKKNNSDLKTNKQTNCWGKVKPRGQDHQEQRNLFGF